MIANTTVCLDFLLPHQRAFHGVLFGLFGPFAQRIAQSSFSTFAQHIFLWPERDDHGRAPRTSICSTVAGGGGMGLGGTINGPNEPPNEAILMGAKGQQTHTHTHCCISQSSTFQRSFVRRFALSTLSNRPVDPMDSHRSVLMKINKWKIQNTIILQRDRSSCSHNMCEPTLYLWLQSVGILFVFFFLLAAPRPRNYISHFPNFAAFIIIAQCAVALLLHIHFFHP